MFRMLGCVIYSLIENYVVIQYQCLKLKTLSSISPKPTFEQTGFNILLVRRNIKLLLNLVSCHGFMKKKIKLW